MLRTVIFYRGNEGEVALLETQDARVARGVAKAALQEYREGMRRCGDGVLAAVIKGEMQQAIRALRAAGMEMTK